MTGNFDTMLRQLIEAKTDLLPVVPMQKLRGLTPSARCRLEPHPNIPVRQWLIARHGFPSLFVVIIKHSTALCVLE